ncbi:hypothetical protein chiPu_0000274 [Chiloscyllium punctatum]|uniref:UDENN domain-containing protein n=1 Tax=Chiloscyllium punctatum TaxID=137246 RepID=A0A401RUU0_CHIPU|nr:hypothetical protein [Chiloscyllium punctatum]
MEMCAGRATEPAGGCVERLIDVENEPNINRSPSLPWDRFAAWVHCICVVGFDLELGQAVEVIYPPHAKLSDKEKTSICYLSFPDSNSGCLGDTQFCFRIRQSSNRRNSLDCLLDQYDRDAPVYLKKDSAHYYGYVYFRQVRDKTLKRGYFQKSLVLLSKLPYVNFFHFLLKLIAPEYFDKSEPCLEAACNDIDCWPAPIPGKALNLPTMGIVIKVRIPTLQDKPGATQIIQSEDEIDTQVSFALPNIHEVDLFSRDEEIIKQVQKGIQQKRPSEAQSAILRRYLLELTQSFIIPLERYVASLMPLQKSISPWKSPPQLKPFSEEEFMKTLEKAGPQLTSRLKGDWIGLYRQFLKSPNFDGWFRSRWKEMTQKLEALHLEALCDADLLMWIQKHTEVEVVDLVLKLKEKLVQAKQHCLPIKQNTLEKLQMHIEAIILSLPEDLQSILLKNGTT